MTRRGNSYSYVMHIPHEVLIRGIFFFTGNSDSLGVNLGDVLMFITGLQAVPPLGFDKSLRILKKTVC